MIYIYRILWIILAPIVDIWFLIRMFKGKEEKGRLKERLGVASIARPKGDLVWFHCASVGESLSVQPLIKQLLDENKELNILVTTGTVTSAKLMHERLPKGAIHQYVPIDFYYSVKMFMEHWQPTISIFVESEFWPELVTQAPNAMLINARISDRSFKRYKKLNAIIRSTLNRFKLCLAQTTLDAERLSKLCDAPVEYTGNLKYDVTPTSVDFEALEQLQNIIQNKKVIVCASTHNPEETLHAALNAKLKKEHDVLTIISPRHPHRGKQVEDAINALELDLNVVRRGEEKNLPTKNCNIYIADTLGEMNLWYKLADIVVMGGSFIPHGGQNPYEPLKMGKLTICGPHMFNFKEMMSTFKEREIILQAESIDELEKDLTHFLKNDTQKEIAEKRISSSMDDLGGATLATAEHITNRLKGWQE